MKNDESEVKGTLEVKGTFLMRNGTKKVPLEKVFQLPAAGKKKIFKQTRPPSAPAIPLTKIQQQRDLIILTQ